MTDKVVCKTPGCTALVPASERSGLCWVCRNVPQKEYPGPGPSRRNDGPEL